jgi:radical SAM protein with 4Fe4S-binding SPASM domain
MGAARPKLHSVAIELTALCNQKCDYCYNAWREDGGAELSAGHRDKLLPRVERLLAAVELDHVTLTGGEPFARADLFELLDLLAAHHVPAQIISNGGLIGDAHAARLAPYRVRYVQITLNGPDRALHEAHVGAGCFERTLSGIRALLRHEVPVVGCIVLTKKNCAHAAAILELWHELGVRHIALSRFSPAGYAARHAAQLLPSRRDLIRAFEQADPFGRERTMTLTCTMPVPPCAVETERFGAIRFGTCPIGTPLQEFALGPDGRLRHCTLHGSGLGGGGDVLDSDFDVAAVVAGQEPRRYRAETPEFCRGCLHEKTCAGGCGAAAEWVLGHARRHADPFVMQHVDDELAARLERQRRDGRTHLEMIL